MLRLAVLAVFMVACGAPRPSSTVHDSPSSHPALTLQAIAAQPSDLSTAVVVCSWSGGFATYANYMNPTFPAKAQDATNFWQRLQSAGATGGWVQDLSISEDVCQRFYSGSTGLVSHVTSIVARFQDTTTAASTYRANAETFGMFSPSMFASAPTTSGSATGLGPNSRVATPQGGPTMLATWQHGDYYFVVIVFGIATSEAKPALLKIDARVK